jgi:hypothetical protein
MDDPKYLTWFLDVEVTLTDNINSLSSSNTWASRWLFVSHWHWQMKVLARNKFYVWSGSTRYQGTCQIGSTLDTGLKFRAWTTSEGLQSRCFLRNLWVTDWEEQSPSCETSSSAAVQEMYLILWNPNIVWRVHKSASGSNPRQSPYFLTIQLNISPRIRLDVSSGFYTKLL